MNKAREALQRAVANGKPIDWDVIAPKRPRDDFADVKRPRTPEGSSPIHDPWGLSRLD
jgi:hypothetical protein